MTTIPLVVRLPNWVGDVCMALPALAALHAAGFAIHAFGRGWAADLLAGLPYQVERVPSGVWSQASAMRATGAAHGLLLTNSLSSAVAMRLAGVDAVGHGGEGRALLLAQTVERLDGVHEVETFWRLAAATIDRDASWELRDHRLGGPPAALGLFTTATHRAQARSALDAAGVRAPFTVVAPLAVGTIAGRAKVWPHHAALVARLVADGRVVVACPGPGEDAATAAAVPGARLLPGLGLGAYAAVMAQAEVVVANDTGPMHVAAAVGAPVVGVFGVSDPRRTRPWGARARAVGSASGWPYMEAVWSAL
ncbi:MAG TPA: glycosyltransferase family 9 protein [Planctomycetota bacterium]|nr:glycosyltransferase family 9 protein [Planctomycetota bacterium]